MISDLFTGKWKQLKGNIKTRWGKLTDDEIDQVEGEMEKMIGLLQEKYAYTREKAEAELTEFLSENN